MQDCIEYEPEALFGNVRSVGSYMNPYMKIYHDGGHYVGTLLLPTRKFPTWRTRLNSDMDRLYRDYYREALREQKETGKSRYRVNAMRLTAKMQAIRALEKTFPEQKEEIRRRSDDVHTRMLASVFGRKKRFRRKAFLNEWQYFVTVTYDSTLYASEDEFREAVNKTFSNLHTRSGWRYMGVWEQGELNERLHFHCLLYVPEGEMVGAIYDRRDYAKKTHGVRVTHSNTYFERRFGRNDFEPLDRCDLQRSIEYILKYLEKSGEKIRYSRGIPSEICIPVRTVDVADSYSDYVEKFVIFDDVINWERDVLSMKPSDMNMAKAIVNRIYVFDTLRSKMRTREIDGILEIA